MKIILKCYFLICISLSENYFIISLSFIIINSRFRFNFTENVRKNLIPGSKITLKCTTTKAKLIYEKY